MGPVKIIEPNKVINSIRNYQSTIEFDDFDDIVRISDNRGNVIEYIFGDENEYKDLHLTNEITGIDYKVKRKDNANISVLMNGIVLHLLESQISSIVVFNDCDNFNDIAFIDVFQDILVVERYDDDGSCEAKYEISSKGFY